MSALLELAKIFAGGVTAAIITLVVSGFRVNKELERTASNLAIQLTDIFERYALDCAAIPEQHANDLRENPFDYSGIAILPPAPDLPTDDAGWRAIDTALAIDVRTFGTRRNQSGAIISSVAEHGDADDIEQEVEAQAVALGTVAWSLAARFRARYNLGETHIAWAVGDHFTQEAAAIAERKKREAAEMANMWAVADAAGDDAA